MSNDRSESDGPNEATRDDCQAKKIAAGGRRRSAQLGIDTSLDKVVAIDDLEQFRQLYEDMADHFAPENQAQMAIVVEIAACRWQIQKLFAYESSLTMFPDANLAVQTPKAQMDAICKLVNAFCRIQVRLGLIDKAMQAAISKLRQPKASQPARTFSNEPNRLLAASLLRESENVN